MSTVPFSRSRNTPLAADLAKQLPSNIDAERSILGAILVDNHAIKDLHASLDANDFFLPQHRVIFLAMLELLLDHLKNGQPLDRSVDLVTLTEYLATAKKLSEAGDAAYLASLADGMPRVSNVKYYADIVKEKARLRGLIHLTHNIQSRALEGMDSPDQLIESINVSVKTIAQKHDDNPSVVVGFQSLLNRECAPIEFAIEPLLSRRGTGELYSPRGWGKSLVATHMAVEIAMGADSLWSGHRGGGGHWNISRPFRQLYVYGEMDESEIQERVRTLARMRGSAIPTDEQLGTMCMDFQKGWRPKISTARDRKFIEQRIFDGGYEALWLDNLSTLWPSAQEAETDRDAILAEWYADLNQHGIWVMFLHHAGKSGEQRGGSGKEDMLACVLKLRHPSNYQPKDKLRVEVHVEKNRHKCLDSRTLMPFEIQLTADAQAKPIWVTRPALAAQRAAAFEMFKNKMPTMIVGQEVGVSRATAYRWAKDYAENPNPDFHVESDE